MKIVTNTGPTKAENKVNLMQRRVFKTTSSWASSVRLPAQPL